MRGYIKTIQDLEQMYYIDPQMRGFLTKTDAPVISSTTGVYNPIYGAKAWVMLNQEINVWSVLPKIPWNQSGWRVITARSATKGTGGVAENGAIPATTKPTWALLKATPRSIAHPFSASEVMQFLGENGADDTLGDTMGALREYFAKEHPEHLNKMLMEDASAEALAAGADRTTTDQYDLESLDRIISNDSEEDAFGSTYHHWFDPWGTTVDRDSGTTYDSYVSHASGIDRTFTMDMLDTAIRSIKVNSGYRPNVIITGEDTLERIVQEQMTMQRYVDVSVGNAGISVDGVKTEGIDTGMNVASYRGIPIITSQDVPQDTISRIFFVNTDFLKIKVAKPTQYFETGMSKGDPFGIGKLGDEGMYRTMAEVVCFNFLAQGKIRDLE